MFKKPYKLSTQSILSTKDRKNLISQLQKQFDLKPASSVSILTEWKVKKIEKSKVLIYTDQINPLFVDSTSNHNLFPTLYAFNFFPDLVKWVFYICPTVSKFIENGANLMWKGVLNFEEIGNFKVDDLAVVRTTLGNSIAVGIIPIDKQTILKIGRLEGVAVYVFHYLGDWLYKSGNQQLASSVLTKVDQTEYAPTTIVEMSLSLTEEISEKKTLNVTQMISELYELNPINEKPVENNNPLEISMEPFSDSAEINDRVILQSFLNAVHLNLKKEDFPIENSHFWNNHIVPCFPTAQIPDIKLSSYKKMGQFFKELDKLGVLKYKEVSKKNATAVLESINYQHELVKNWKPNIELSTLKELKEPQKATKFESLFRVTNLYKPSIIVLGYLEENVEREYLEKDELSIMLKKYLNKEKLIVKDRINLNEKLKKDFALEKTVAVNKNKDSLLIDEEGTLQSNNPIAENSKVNKMSFKSLLTEILKHCSPAFKVTDAKTNKEVLKKGRHMFVGILIEKIGNKFLTKISGLDFYGLNLKDLLYELQIKFATSGSIQEKVLNKLIVEEVAIQGCFGEELSQFLVNEVGLLENCIQIVDKVKLKKHKTKK